MRKPTHEGYGSLLVLALVAPIVGAASGLIGAVFRLALAEADRLRGAAIVWAHGWNFGGFLIIAAGCAAAVAFAAWLVRRFSPYASGSGIPQVEAILQDKLPPTPPRLLLVKFFGGLSAIGAGLALGREGPSVQMGAAVAHLVAKISGRNWLDCKVLIAAGAGAGLATAFNAPIAGAIFVLEELVRRFDTRIAIAALGASAAAIAVARVFLGAAPDFTVEPLAYVGVQFWLLFAGLGAAAGLAGHLYNGAVLGMLATMDRLSRWPIELRAAVIGAAVGALGYFTPALIGGGDDITQRTLSGGAVLAMLLLTFLLRFGLGAVSYAAPVPGGLFAPLLALGAQLGLFCGILCRLALPDAGVDPTAFAVVGMAAFFTAVVQAPVTGIVLVIEMTASFTMLLPMIAACFAAMLVPNLLNGAPIYDSLRERLFRLQQSETASAATRMGGEPAENSR
ncbi:MAG TPA: H(+)/Cl(-) exchange transporter ClcA [Stellaceae bacterium]|nr:H(+)/Cl(-) exchange transporter ClcA [Stellaceae bacterium]